MTTLVGRTVSHYKILEQLGGGAMGVVYKARQLKPDRLVALKFLPPRLTRNPDARKRFIQEVRTASALQHSNIGLVYDVEETDDGQLYVAMEFYSGDTLKKRLTRGPVPLATALEVALQTARGLARAHRRGLIHRDIRPSNIFVTSDGTVKIVDFGLAMLAAESRTRSVTALASAPDYMSPEQVGKGTVDSRTDIWSLGVVLFELLTGRRPFKGKNPHELIHAILTAPLPRPSVVGHDIPDELDDVLLQALRKN
ncbi:MAG: serine/threonine-protein kinase, partial [Bacteroidota bacterium]